MLRTSCFTSPDPGAVYKAYGLSKPERTTDSLSAGSYEELTQNLSNQQKNTLEQAMSATEVSLHLEETISVLAHTDMDARLWDDPVFHLTCLQALQKGRIDVRTFATSQLFYNVMRLHTDRSNIQAVPIFEGTMLNPRTEELNRSWSIAQGNNHVFSLTASQEADFYRHASNLPSLDNYFLLAPNQSTTFDRLKGKPYYSYFLFDGSRDGNMRIIPSLGIMECFLKAKFGRNAPKIAVRLLLSSLRSLHEGIKEGSRDLCLNFAGLDPIGEVDGFPCEGAFNEAEYHDLSHLVFFGYIPREFQLKFYTVSQLIEDDAELGDVYASLVNMEHHPFTSGAPRWLAFWESIAESFRACKNENYPPLVEKLVQQIHQHSDIPIETLRDLQEMDLSVVAEYNHPILLVMIEAAARICPVGSA